MGVLPGACLFILLLVNLGEATTIDLDNLNDIVQKFHQALPQAEKLKQFAFLMALNKDQCSAKKLTNFKPTVPQKTPQKNVDYIAFKPGPMKEMTNTKETLCSETHILFPPNQNAQSPAQTFGQFQTEEETFRDGGCVIFYTTNTPCTRRCFKEFNENVAGRCLEIGGPLKRVPFDNWHNNPNIDMYFVYTQLYLPKKEVFSNEADYVQFQTDTSNGFRRLDENDFYSITRCDNNGCRLCDRNTNFCLGNWPAWSELQ